MTLGFVFDIEQNVEDVNQWRESSLLPSNESVGFGTATDANGFERRDRDEHSAGCYKQSPTQHTRHSINGQHAKIYSEGSIHSILTLQCHSNRSTNNKDN